MPTWTFAASAEVVVYRGARPVLVDVDRRTLNATPEGILAAVTPRTRAVIAVHVAGLPVDIERLVALLEPTGSRSSRTRRTRSRAGSAGRTAPMPAPSGGLERSRSTPRRPSRPARAECSSRMTTRSQQRARVMSLHGISRDAWNRYASSGSWYYEIEDAGYKYNMTDIAAALGLVQLERAEELLEARRAHRGLVLGGAAGIHRGRPPRAPAGRRSTDRTPGTCTSSALSSTDCGSTVAR